MRIADSCGGSRVRHAHYYIGINRMLLCQRGSHSLSRRIKQTPVNDTVRTGKINIFKDAKAFFTCLGPVAFQSVPSNRYYLAGFNFPDKFGTNVVKSTCLRGYNPTTIDGPDAQGTHTERVPYSKKPVLRQDHHTICSLKPVHGISYSVNPVCFRGRDDEISYNFCICSALEGVALGCEFFIKILSIEDVSIVGYGKSPGILADHYRLGVADAAGTGGGIAVMTYGYMSGKLG